MKQITGFNEEKKFKYIQVGYTKLLKELRL